MDPSVEDPTMMDPAVQQAAMLAGLEAQKVDRYLPYMIGTWSDALGLGILFIMWARWYIHVRSTDSKWTQALIWYLMLPTLASSTILYAHDSFIFVDGFGYYMRIMDIGLIRAIPVNFTLSRVPSAAFFAVRAWKLNNKPLWLPVVLIPCLFACLAAGVMGTIGANKLPLPQLALSSILVYSSIEVASDIVITSSLFYGLFKQKSGWAHTDRLVKRLMRLVLETQTPPALTAIVFLTVSLTTDNGSTLAYFFVFYTKVHVICLMAVVNSRIEMSRVAGGARTFKPSSHSQGSIQVHTSTHYRIEGPDGTEPHFAPNAQAGHAQLSTSSLLNPQAMV